MRSRRCAVAFLLVFLLSAGCARPLTGNPHETVPPSATAAYEEFAAADFSVTDARGQAVMLSDYLGQPVIVKFWTIPDEEDCGELAALQRAYEQYGEEIAFLVVNRTDGASEAQRAAAAYLSELGCTFPVLFDLDGTAAAACASGAAPATLFIDRDGFIVTRSTGAIDEETLLFGLKLL